MLFLHHRSNRGIGDAAGIQMKGRSKILGHAWCHSMRGRFALWRHINHLFSICRHGQLSGRQTDPCQGQLESTWAAKAEAEGAEKSGNWFLARRSRATGKAAGSAGVKHQGVFGGQIFPIESAPVGKELVIKELEFFFLLPGMKIAGLLFNLLQLFGWGREDFLWGGPGCVTSAARVKPNQKHSEAEGAMLSAFCRQDLVPRQLFTPCPFARCCSWSH